MIINKIIETINQYNLPLNVYEIWATPSIAKQLGQEAEQEKLQNTIGVEIFNDLLNMPLRAIDKHYLPESGLLIIAKLPVPL